MMIRYKSCQAFLKVEEDEDTGESYLILHNLDSKYQGLGHGTEVLRLVREYSNAQGLEVRCHPYALNGDHDRLRAWYERNGFLDDGEWFVYWPKR